jgi:hypothetical protein
MKNCQLPQKKSLEMPERFGGLTTVAMKDTVFSYVTPCSQAFQELSFNAKTLFYVHIVEVRGTGLQGFSNVYETTRPRIQEDIILS